MKELKTYTKIETVFNRSLEGQKELIIGDYRNETVEYLKDNEWVGTEKIDGTNIRVCWDGYSISFAGRTNKSVIQPNLLPKLEEIFCNPETEQIFEQLFGEKEVILYGEGYGNRIQKVGSLYREDNSFILFDVYMVEANLWLKRDAIEDIGKALGIEVVPIVFRGTINEGIEFVKKHPMSTIGKAPMEGIVCKPAVDMLTRTGDRVVVKIKVHDFARN